MMYSVLGVSRSASKETIRSAYLRLAKQLHPDVNKTSEAAQKFQRVQEAYEVLSDDAKRREHDRLMRGPENGPSSPHGVSTRPYGSAQGDGFGPGSKAYWHYYQRARTQQHDDPGRNDAFQQKYREAFDRDQYKKKLYFGMARFMPLLIPGWMLVFMLAMRRDKHAVTSPQAAANMVTYDHSGRAYMTDAYGNRHRLPDFDRQ